jgi:hypothetical protein
MSAALAEIGHNQPPEPTPFETVKARIDELMIEAKNWLDGSIVQTQAEADAVSKLLSDIRDAENAADDARVKENEPFDLGKAAVQAKYAPLIADTKARKGVTVLAADACKKALAPFLKKQDDAKLVAAAAARKEAEEKAEAARKAMQAADSLDFAKRAEAEILVQEAAVAERAANRADNVRVGGFGGKRAITLRSVWKAALIDRKAAAAHFWRHYPEGFDAVLQNMADAAVRDGACDIPGFNVIEERVAQ